MTSYTAQGTGPNILLLHGGGGPQTVAGFAELLAVDHHVVTPTHPGFGGTPRPEGLTTVAGLAELYRDLLDELDLDEVTVVGNSIGGWIAAELALLGSDRPGLDRVGSIVLVDAVGIEVADHPVVDFFALDFPTIAKLSYFDPEKFRIDPAALPPAAQELIAGNRATLAVYATEMTDPTLRDRLAGIKAPTHVIWGDCDRIVDPEYGRAFAEAIPGATFEVLAETGHLPQLESPELLASAVRRVAGDRGRDA
ncbi:alpha/beta hydrolase [Streptomyces sp. SID13031]|uniref:alpha/beta fold hydrolase n=1 Tax=Streptomyces sp. SID13031 TaxID=2706046 RepID=UPI0013C98008|nr:alpha/beta hydrolase [Streptomyces sp. SID13031]NEA31554.1 alpha/beta hydrolase [Streptomyces sp. SID13031]